MRAARVGAAHFRLADLLLHLFLALTPRVSERCSALHIDTIVSYSPLHKSTGRVTAAGVSEVREEGSAHCSARRCVPLLSALCVLHCNVVAAASCAEGGLNGTAAAQTSSTLQASQAVERRGGGGAMREQTQQKSATNRKQSVESSASPLQDCASDAVAACMASSSCCAFDQRQSGESVGSACQLAGAPLQ